MCLLSPSLTVLVVLNHYLAFQYFAEEYYPFSEVSSDFGNTTLYCTCVMDRTFSVDVCYIQYNQD